MNEARYVNTTDYIFTFAYDENISGTTDMGNYISEVGVSPILDSWDHWYKPVHGYLAATVCVFGVVANILNIIVLTRKNMISSTNIILTGLAITDAITMAFYFPFALQMYVIYGTKVTTERDTEGCATFQLSYAIVSVICHSISIWLTVTLAVFRFIFIRFPRRGARYCNVQRAKTAVVSVSVVVAIVCIPNAITYEIKSESASAFGYPNDTNASIWWVDVKSKTDAHKALMKLNMCIQSIIVKLLPCLLLTMFSVLLVQTMQSAERRRKKMMINKNSVGDGEKQPIGCGAKRSRRSQRTTRMLLTVVILFVVTETPQGVMSLLSGLIDNFFHNIYSPLGDLLDILALINNGINFVLYCTMSKQFRDTFIAVFCHCFPKLAEGRKMQTVTTMIATRESEV